MTCNNCGLINSCNRDILTQLDNVEPKKLDAQFTNLTDFKEEKKLREIRLRESFLNKFL